MKFILILILSLSSLFAETKTDSTNNYSSAFILSLGTPIINGFSLKYSNLGVDISWDSFDKNLERARNDYFPPFSDYTLRKSYATIVGVGINYYIVANNVSFVPMIGITNQLTKTFRVSSFGSTQTDSENTENNFLYGLGINCNISNRIVIGTKWNSNTKISFVIGANF